MLLPLLRVEEKGQKEVGTVPHGARSLWDPWLIWVSLLFIFFLALGNAATMATMTLHAFSRWGFGHIGQLRTASCQQSI
jgi:hypothetical protein